MNRLKLKIYIALVFVLTAAVYFNGSGNAFVFDDNAVIENNELMKGPFSPLKLCFSNYWAGTPYEKGVLLYRPAATLSYGIDYKLWNGNPRGFHYTNIFLNALNAALLFYLLVLLLEASNVTVPFYALLLPALLWALHPVHTEAVNMITGRAELIAACFMFGSFILYLKDKTALAAASFLLALAGKESAVMLPFIIAAYDYLSGRKFKRDYYILAVGAILLYLGLRFSVLGALSAKDQSGILDGKSLDVRSFTVIMVIGYYTRLVFWPWPLSPDYSDMALPQAFYDPVVLIPLACIAGALYFIARYGRKYPFVSFPVVFFLIAILPVSNIISIGAVIGERFLYLPSAALACGLVFIFARVDWKKQLAVFLSVCVLVFGTLVYFRNFEWKDNAALWDALRQNRPDNVRANFNKGFALETDGMMEEALDYYKKVLEPHPRQNWQPDKHSMDIVRGKVSGYYVKKSIEAYKKKDFDGSFNLAAEALKYAPESADAWVMTGNNYYQKGRFTSAADAYAKALEFQPAHPEAKRNLEMLKAAGKVK